MFDHLEEQKKIEEKKEPVRQAGGDFVLKNTIDKLTSGRASVLSPFVATTHELEARFKKLEEKGKKRGKRFSVIGIVGGFVIALSIMYFCYLILNDVINISVKLDENSSTAPDIRRGIKNDNLIIKSTSSEENLLIKDNVMATNSSATIDAVNNDPGITREEETVIASSSVNETSSIIDTDNDGLSDAEEIALGTDMNNPDTDGDGYLDGVEVSGGYDPMK